MLEQSDLLEFAQRMASAGASFEETCLSFRRTGCGYIDLLWVMRKAYPTRSLTEARSFFEMSFDWSSGSGLFLVLAVSDKIVAALKSALPLPPDARSALPLIAFLRRDLSALAIAVHFRLAWEVPWQDVCATAWATPRADDESASVTRDLLEGYGLDWTAELAAIAPSAAR